MSFVSSQFLVLVASCILLYFIVPGKIRWIILLAGSFVFYWMNSGKLLAVLLFASLFTYGAGLWMDNIYAGEKKKIDNNRDISREERKKLKASTKNKAKGVLILGVIVDLGLLVLLKYSDIFITRISNMAPGLHIPAVNLLKPLGISFWTLQALSYLFDVYRKKYKAGRNPFKYILYMSYFPQIVQGPISRYDRLADQLYDGHSFNYSNFTNGMQLMLWGWAKKMIIADRVSGPVSAILDNYKESHGLILLLGVALYGVQIYTDFSGGMDIARGFSQILGIDLELNFEQPYFSKSIEEFWRRWHITLGGWMRDYVFYPLSLSKTFAGLSRFSRKFLGQKLGKKLPSFLAMYIVYMFVGIWHGPELKYFAYGLYNGTIIVLGLILGEYYEKLRDLCRIDANSISWRVFQIIRTFILVSIGRFFPCATGVKAACRMIGRTFTQWWDLSFLVDGSLMKLGIGHPDWIVLAVSILVLFLVDYIHEKGIHIRETIAAQHIVFRWLIYYAAILAILIFGIYGPAYNASSFIYGNF